MGYSEEEIAMNERLVREEARQIENEYVRNTLLNSERPELWTSQTRWNIAKAFRELEERARRCDDER